MSTLKKKTRNLEISVIFRNHTIKDSKNFVLRNIGNLKFLPKKLTNSKTKK